MHSFAITASFERVLAAPFHTVGSTPPCLPLSANCGHGLLLRALPTLPHSARPSRHRCSSRAAVSGTRPSQPEFKGSSKEAAPQPKAPEPAPRFFPRLLAGGAGVTQFVHHSMQSRAENFCLQLSVSNHVMIIAFTVKVSITLDHVARCEGIP